MLNKMVKQIQESNPEILGMDDVFEKVILHHDIIAVFHNQGFLSKITFIGDTSLRLCYGGNRLSEDLDFTCGSSFNREYFKGMDEYLEQFLKNK